jgi:hypothetical protein
MQVTVHFVVEHSKNLNHPGIMGYFIKLTTRLQSVKHLFSSKTLKNISNRNISNLKKHKCLEVFFFKIKCKCKR